MAFPWCTGFDMRERIGADRMVADGMCSDLLFVFPSAVHCCPETMANWFLYSRDLNYIFYVFFTRV